MTAKTVLTPSKLGQYLKTMMDRDRILSNIVLQGELSNYKAHSSGHHYFSLKDSEGVVGCVMFASQARSLKFRPQDGTEVQVSGNITVFPRDGKYQLYCKSMSVVGEGDLSLAFEELKAKLEREGLFDPVHKKPLPTFPKTIALVTSPTGAAVQDMIRILTNRYPMLTIYVVPVRVQGEGSAHEIASAIQWVNNHKAADLIIAGRGGGSMEDLWSFNEEEVARAIFGSKIPIISAVGHEPDTTIADYVADVCASTPSNAAERAVPELRAIEYALQTFEKRINARLLGQIQYHRDHLSHLQNHPQMKNPMYYIGAKSQLLDHQAEKLYQSMETILARESHSLARLSASLDALSPLKVMGRGYAILRDEEGEYVTSVEQVSPGDLLQLDLADGIAHCRTEKITPNQGGKS